MRGDARLAAGGYDQDHSGPQYRDISVGFLQGSDGGVVRGGDGVECLATAYFVVDGSGLRLNLGHV